MNQSLLYFTVILLSLEHLVPGVSLATAHKAEPKVLVPAYFYPSGEGSKAWQRLFDSADRASIVAIVNPDSGPGKRVDDNYLALFPLAKRSRITLIGYVTLSYGKRPVSAVKAEVDRWLHFYPEIRGIFFDEQPSAAEHAAFARECFVYARQKIPKACVISNPGVVCAREYFEDANGPTICTFEHEKGFDTYKLPAWADQIPAERFAVLIYHVEKEASMRQALEQAIRKHSGYIYITDSRGSMPWGRLPTYWDELLDAVSATSRHAKRGSQ